MCKDTDIGEMCSVPCYYNMIMSTFLLLEEMNWMRRRLKELKRSLLQ